MLPEELFGPRRSIRVSGFHYSDPGAYFVTICAYRKRCVFGRVRANTVELTPLGRFVEQCWAELPQHFAHVEIPVYVVMPNHLHGIIVLHKSLHNRKGRPEGYQRPVPGSVPTLVRCLKAAVTLRAKRAHMQSPHPIWQRNYFERVIRDGEEYSAAARYILENPLRWQFDKENPQTSHAQRPLS